MARADDKAKKGSGKRRRFRGKMVLPSGAPRAHSHGGHSPANGGWSCGDAGPGNDVPKGKLQTTKHLPGKFRVPAPTKRHHRRGLNHPIGA